MKKLLVVLMAISLVLFAVACAPSKPDPGPTDPTGSTDEPKPSDSAVKPPEGEFDGKIYVGVIAALTGESKLYGDMTLHAAEAATAQINAEGGILGKEVILVVEDEGSDLQSSVNATAKLMENKDLIAILGSQYSARVLATMDVVNSGKIPYFTFGSSAALLAEDSEWLWMMRVADSYTGVGMVKYVTEKMGIKNPAAIHTTDAFGQGLYDVVKAQFAERGVVMKDNLSFGIASDETNVTPQLTQIVNSDADCLMAMGTIVAPYIVNQAADIGIEIPRVGSMSFGNQTVFTQSGSNSDDWFSLSEWSTEVDLPENQNYINYVKDTYGSLDTTGQPGAYDAMFVLKAACEAAGSVTDPQAINDAIAKTDGLRGASGTLATRGTHCLCTELIVTQNENLRAKVIDRISVR